MAVGPSEGWRWWIDGLVDAVLLAEERSRRRRAVRLVPVEGGAVIEHGGGRHGSVLLRATAEGLRPQRLARRLTGRVVEVTIGADQMLTRRLGPLPPESRPYVEGIVAHQLERMTPWLAADTLATHRIETVGPDDPRLTVTVEATSKSLHRDLVAAIAALAPREVRLVRPADAERAEVVLPVAEFASVAERARVATFLQGGLAVLLVLAISLGWWIRSTSAEIDRRLAEIDARIETYRARLAPPAGAATGERERIAALSRETPMAVITLDNLSAALPDDTHLTTLQIDRERLRMTGITRDIAALTTAVEATTLFTEPVFSAPTVRSKQGDRFTLDFVVAGSTRTRP